MVGIIVVALLGFIFTEFGRNGRSIFGQSSSIGSINGKKVDVKDYQTAIDEREAQMKAQNPNANIDESQRAQLRDQIWTNMVNEQLMKDVDGKLGITRSHRPSGRLVVSKLDAGVS